MHNRCLISTRLLIVLILASTAAAWAQQPAERPEDPSQAQPQPAVAPPGPEDSAVQAILATEPSTPAEWAQAAKILADLGRPDLGKGYLKRIIDAKLSGPQLAELAQQFGSPMFAKMATTAEMLPEARQLADAVLAAARRQLEDPQRLAALVKQLQDPSAETRHQALLGLQEAQGAAVGPLLAVLADPARAGEHPNVRAALARLGPDAVGPLLGILEGAEDSRPELVAQAILVLAQMDAKEATFHLLRPCLAATGDVKVRAAAAAAIRRLVGQLPSKREAVGMLAQRAKVYFDGRQPIRAEADGGVTLWRWDNGAGQCVAKQYSADDASALKAAWLARDAYALAGDDPEIRLLYLATMLEAAVYDGGIDNPLPDGPGTTVAKAAEFGAAEIERVLEYAMAGGHAAAATAAASILGRIGTAEGQLCQGPQPAPLVRAMRHADRRLRLAATDAVLRLQPDGPFAGSSYVPQSLAFFAATGGVRRALVAGPSTETSRRLAGALAALGFQVDSAVTGRELIRLATTSPDYELALVDAAIEQPTVDLLLELLRQDPRSEDLRLGLIARSGYLPRATQVARRDPLALAFSRPQTKEAIAWQVEQLQALDPRSFVDHAQRQRQAAEALDRLAELSGAEDTVYDVRGVRAAVLVPLYVPTLSSKAAAVLGNLNAAESQQALVELASRWTQPLRVRQAAVRALRINTQRHGILLTTEEILRQYDRYNHSQALDAGTQQVLALILDCIEAPTQPLGARPEAPAERPEGR